MKMSKKALFVLALATAPGGRHSERIYDGYCDRISFESIRAASSDRGRKHYSGVHGQYQLTAHVRNKSSMPYLDTKRWREFGRRFNDATLKNNTMKAFSNLMAFCSLMLVLTLPAFAQSTQGTVWTGQAQCQLSLQDQGFAHQETQTWALTGEAPSVQGMQIYPATWRVTGRGGVQRPTVVAQWNNNVPPTNAPLAIFIRASDNRLIIKPWHSQVVVHNATTAFRQVGGTSTAAVSEWLFPQIEADPNQQVVAGTGTVAVIGDSIAIPSANSRGTANCTWQFTKGGINSADVPSIRTAPIVGTGVGGTMGNVSTPQVSNSNGMPVPGKVTSTSGKTSSTSPGESGSTSQGTISPSSQSCPSLGTAGISGLNSAQNLGTLPAGASTTVSNSLDSQTATKLYRATLAGGADANFTLNAGSDFDLDLYDTSGNSIGCSQTRDSNSENFTARFQNSQNNEVIIEVAAHSWSASGANFSLKLVAANFGSVSLPTQPNKNVYDPNPGTSAASSSPTSSCSDPGGSPTSTAFNNPTNMGYLNLGQSQIYSSNLNSVSDRRFVQVTVKPGLEANISLNAGSDYDLYIFNQSHTIINCATSHGSNSENIKLQFDSSQTDTTIIIEVAAYGWSNGVSNFTLGVSVGNPVTATQLPSGAQNKNIYTAGGSSKSSTSSSPPSPQCADPGGSSTSSTLSTPISLGTIYQGGSMSYSGTLASVTDRAFYQVTLGLNTEANISLTGGSDYDLYFFSSPSSMSGCSTTRVTGGENYTTHFANSQSNSMTIEVAAYSWSADAASYKLTITGVAPNSSQVISGLTTQPIAVPQNLQLKSQPTSGSGQQNSSQQASSQTGTSSSSSPRTPVSYTQNNVVGIWSAKQCTLCHYNGGGTSLNLSDSSTNTYQTIHAMHFNASNPSSHPLLTCSTNTNCTVNGLTQHPGGQVLSTNSAEYKLILQWIVDGMNP